MMFASHICHTHHPPTNLTTPYASMFSQVNQTNMKVIGPCPAQTSQPISPDRQESLADQVRVLVKTASSEETIVLKPEVTEHEFHDLTPATWLQKEGGRWGDREMFNCDRFTSNGGDHWTGFSCFFILQCFLRQADFWLRHVLVERNRVDPHSKLSCSDFLCLPQIVLGGHVWCQHVLFLGNLTLYMPKLTVFTACSVPMLDMFVSLSVSQIPNFQCLIEQPSFSAPTSHEPAPLVLWKHVSGDNPLLDSSRPGVGMTAWRIGGGIILWIGWNIGRMLINNWPLTKHVKTNRRRCDLTGHMTKYVIVHHLSLESIQHYIFSVSTDSSEAFCQPHVHP